MANSEFSHAEIDKWTRVEPSRNEKSVTDNATVNHQIPRQKRDRVKMGPEFGSDHRLLVIEKQLKIISN